MTTTAAHASYTLARSWLEDPATHWSMGTFGAIGEFMRDADEAHAPTDGESTAIATARGGLRLAPADGLRLVAYETPGADGTSWNQSVALCLPQAAASMRTNGVLTELGPDREPLRPGDHGAVLFDLGLGAPQVDMCIRTADADLVAVLRAHAGRAAFAPDNPSMGAILATSPHRVFLTRLGRLEVYQPIPQPGGVSPEGPHTHLLPQLLRSGRTHAATTPIPAGWVPCAHAFPPHPLRDGVGHRVPFRADTHDAFQQVLAAHGLPELTAIKAQAAAAVRAGALPDTFAAGEGKFMRAAVRVALRQLAHADDVDTVLLARWTERFDARGAAAADEQEQPAHD